MSHRRVTDEYRRATDNYRQLQTSHRWVTDDYRQSHTSHRRLQTSHRRVTDNYRRVTDESQIATDESQTTTTNHSESFFEYIYKTLFSERIWFPNTPMKRWFLLKKRKSKIWCLLKWWKLSYTRNQAILTSISLDIRTWSTETQTNIAFLSYNDVLTHSALLVSLWTHWKYLKLSSFDVFRLVTWSGFKDSQKQLFADVLQNRCS